MEKPKILVIDDDEMTCESVRLALVHEGFDVAVAFSGKAALEAIRRVRPDLAVLDLYLPDMGGWELCRQLKADIATADLPILILSGSNETVDVISGIDAGAFQYITKPVDTDVLAAKIRLHLKLHDR